MVQLLGGGICFPFSNFDCFQRQVGVSNNRGKNPKMDGENHGKPYEQMGDLGKPHYFWKHPGGMSFLEELFPIGAQQAAFCSCLQPDPSCASAAAAVGKAKNPQSCSHRNLLIRPKTREQFKD